MKFFSFRERIAGIIGNLLEHYDHALFGFLAPFIAPLFFSGQDPFTALILTYAILPLGLLTRPLGSLYFGWIGDSWGRRSALFYSLLGMGITTVGIGFLPLYKDIGVWSPILLSLARMLQSFFAAGESSGGAIFVLENTEKAKRSLASGFYSASSLSGILVASGLVFLVNNLGSIEENWRCLFWLGGTTAILGVVLRNFSKQETPFIHTYKLFSILKEHKAPFLEIAISSGFSYITYSLAFTFMNGYLPLVTSLSHAEAIKMNTWLLLGDLLLLPCFGYFGDRLGKEKVMFSAAVFSVVTVIPLFFLIDGACMRLVILIRLAIIVPGVAFSAPYYAWAIEKVSSQYRYLILSLASAFGTQVIGMPTSLVCLWLYRVSGWTWAPGLYLMAWGVGVVYLFYRFVFVGFKLNVNKIK